MNIRATHRWCGAAAIVLLAACGSSGVADKVGGDTVVLRLATIDAVNGNGQSYGPEAFVNALDEVSGGRIKVEIQEGFGEGAADAESKEVEAIAAGSVDGGWPSVRAFADAGISGLEPVEAPMTLASYDAERALVSGPVADQVLARLDGTGVVGLGLTVGPLRRPFSAAAPLLGPDDWVGIRFRVFNSPTQTAAVEALGATPVNAGGAWIDEFAAGNLNAIEFDIAQYAANGLTTEVGNVTSNVVLWPKVFVLSISQERFDALSEQHQEWVREAAAQAVQASVDATYDEDTPARQLCDDGTRFVEASPDQLAALDEALAPVIDELAADPISGPLLSSIQAIAAEHPEPDVPDVPETCRHPAIEEEPIPSTTIPDEVSALPDGAYRVDVRLDDVTAAGQSNAGGTTGTWTLEVHDGHFRLRCSTLDLPGTDCGNELTQPGHIFEIGDLRGTGNTVYFVANYELIQQLTGCLLPVSQTEPDHCGPAGGYHADWTLDGDTLTFTNPGPGSAGEGLIVKPWQKIR
jgi:TRAP-type C4-dicarboxylate transport system substrate-binding protein